MAAKSTAWIDCGEQRAELEQVLQSRSFVRAPTLAHLLSYLGEKLFAGEANQIKEYSIGVEVFHRGPSFDQDSDSIVRVEANRLRKRLAEYYAGEGAAHPIHIVIPVGQYVPEFITVAPNQGQQPAALEVPSTANPSVAEKSGARWFGLSGRARWGLAATLLLLLLGLILLGVGYFRINLHRQAQPAPPALSGQPSFQGTDIQVGPPVGEEIRILSGASRSFVDHAGKLWNADTWFAGGTAIKSSVRHIGRTQDPDFYRTSRQGEFHYDIPLKKGIYELRLHFAETVYGPESAGPGGEGSRIMAVRANGRTLLSRLDVVADAGASATADVKVFPDISPGPDGMLHLMFTGEDGKQAILSAIEILPGVPAHMRPVRVLARETPYYSNDSHWWSPDNYFEGGQMATYTTPVTGTDDPELYETERWGNFSYAIPVAPGKYAVVLHFAARHNGGEPGASSAESTTAHIFNVFCNGKVLLPNFNLLKEARQGDVVTRKFPGLEPNAQGKLLLSFVPVEGYATVTGIEAIPQ
jgi:hypothetical protein